MARREGRGGAGLRIGWDGVGKVGSRARKGHDDTVRMLRVDGEVVAGRRKGREGEGDGGGGEVVATVMTWKYTKRNK